MGNENFVSVNPLLGGVDLRSDAVERKDGMGFSYIYRLDLLKPLLLLILRFTVKVAKAQSCVGTAGEVKWSYWTNVPAYPDSSDLFALEDFPDHPTGSQTLGFLQSPINFTDSFVSMIRGYISVPTTANYVFNITGDDTSIFFLSTDGSPANKVERAKVSGYTSVDQHDKYPEQTSVTLQLTAGQYYYFEMYNFEGGGGDHMTLYWHLDTESDWRIVDYNYINGYSCESTCAPRGTTCDDGNANTVNDQQDGFCNCVGEYPKPSNKIGGRGIVEAYYYDNVDGSYVENDLLNAPKYPLLPDRKERLDGAYGPLDRYTRDKYGSLVQGYLTVPVSGNYEFNITGDNQTFFFLSKNDSIEYKQTHQAVIFNGIGEHDYDNSSFQRIAPLYLETGKYYYFEFVHKENTWRDHFILYWKTPFRTSDRWKPVPKFYLYDYTAEISCIPQGTPCDDGNAFTNNDQYNNNCECVGTPCSGPDCDDAGAKYQAFDSCAPTQNLTTTADNSWLSCGSSGANPNPIRSSQNRWIMYDLNNIYTLDGTRVWNYNVAGETTKGFKNVTIDYSLDGTNWTQLGGSYFWPLAPGTSDYAGFDGPDFNSMKARYVLISAIDNWGGNCSGFSKITFEATLCNPEGTLCDDNDPLTMHDKFDAFCNCRGVNINCGSDTLQLDRITLADGAYKAKKIVNSESVVPATKDITFTAGNSIVLLPGFEIENNAVFTAKIEDCIQTAFVANQQANGLIEELGQVSGFTADTTANDKLKKIIFRLSEAGQVKLVLKDKSENVLVTLIDRYYQNLGTQTKYLPTQRLQKGVYWIELMVGETVLREQLVIN